MSSPTPLSGVKVVDLTRLLPGPLAVRLLADLGAQVVKVEEPEGGDPVRGLPPFQDGKSALASLLLGGHRSIALDLDEKEGREVLEALLVDADVLMEGFRPGVLARFGLAPEELESRHPRLVICSISGWGQEGPLAGHSGHDLSYQAIAGTLAPTGEMPAAPVADLVGAWSAVTAVLAALLERERSGQGAWIDQSLADAAVHANLTAWVAEADGPKEVGERLVLTGSLPCYGIFPTADRKLLAVACLERHFWRRFCSLAAREDLVRHQYDATETIRRAVGDVVAAKTMAEWKELLEGQDVPVAPLLAAAEARLHPQIAHRGVVQPAADGSIRLAFPARFDGKRPPVGGALPTVGEHTRTLLEEKGLEVASRSDRRLRKKGVGARPTVRSKVERWLSRRWGR